MRKLLSAALALVATALTASAALTSTVKFADNYGSGPGGEFLITHSNFPFTPSGLTGTGAFETFCIEKNEFIEMGKTYYVDFSDAARNGGVSGGNPDPLDPRTAYLYTQFQSGSLAGYNYGTGAARVASANALQNAIWFLEGEISTINDGISAADALLAAQFVSAANASGWTSLGSVRVMNVYGNSAGTEHKQDQLVLVPAPGAVLLGLIGLGMLRSRKTA